MHHLPQIWNDKAECASFGKVPARVRNCFVEVLKGQMLQDVRAVDRLAGSVGDGKPLHDVSVADVRGEAFLVARVELPDHGDTLEAKCGAGIEVDPAFRGVPTAAVLHVHLYAQGRNQKPTRQMRIAASSNQFPKVIPLGAKDTAYLAAMNNRMKVAKRGDRDAR